MADEEKTLNVFQRAALATRVGFKVLRADQRRGDPVFPRGIFGSMWSGPGFIGSFAEALSFGSFRGTNIDFKTESGELSSSSLCMAVWQYMSTALTEAPPIVTAYKKGEVSGEVIPDHPLVELLKQPNDFCDGATLLQAFALDWLFSGDSYWVKIFDKKYLQPVQLWYIPYFMMQPVADERDLSVFIKEYQYIVDGHRYAYDPKEVVHFKRGINPRDLRRGIGVFDSVLRDIYTDNQAANFSAAILKNWGVVPFVLSPPKNSKDAAIKAFGDDPVKARAQANRIKAAFMEATTGDHRGEPIVNTIPLEITKLAYSPAELDISALRKIPESRVAAVTGLPAALLQFLVGMEYGTSYASYKEAREQAYESVIAPLLKIIASAINRQLLVDFADADGRRLEMSFDLSSVRVLQEDQDKLFSRADKAVNGGWGMVADARAMVGWTVEESDKVYLRGGHPVLPGEELEPKPEPRQLPPADEDEDAVDGELVEDDDEDDAEKLLAVLSYLIKLLPEPHKNGNGNGNGNAYQEAALFGSTPAVAVHRPPQLKGGDGSGNFDHAGRPGLIGGSAPSGATRKAPSANGMAKMLLAAIKDKEPAVTALLQSIVNDAGGKLAGLQYKIKTEESLTKKLLRESRELNVPPEQVPIRDALRYTAIFEPEDFTAGSQSVLDEFRRQGYDIPKVKHYWDDLEYRGTNTNVSKDGVLFELQFHTPESYRIKEEHAHPIYEQVRELPNDHPKRSELMNKLANLWRTVTIPVGALGMKSERQNVSTT